MKIIWTKHAIRRSIERGINKEEVEVILQNPIEVIKDRYNDKNKCFGKLNDSFSKESKYLIIVHTIFNECATIITVMITDKGGVKADGFSRI